MRRVRVSALSSRRDDRGVSVALGAAPFGSVPTPQDLHVASVVQGAVRGNHLHRERAEVLVLHAAGPWLLRWDEASEGPVYECRVEGPSVALVEVGPGCSHAVVNLAESELVLVSMSSGRYRPDADETVRREVWPAEGRSVVEVEPPPDAVSRGTV